jgi:hypothetical protein
MDYAFSEEFFGDLRVLVERWCDERKLGALSRLLPGYLSMSGLTGGWANPPRRLDECACSRS